MDKLETLIVEAKATLGNAIIQRAPSDDAIIAENIDRAYHKLERALDELRRQRREVVEPDEIDNRRSRYECPACSGSGEIAPDAECPDCDGTGAVVPVAARGVGA